MTNYLLLKHQIGQHRSLPRDLPQDRDHSYGLPKKRDEFGAYQLFSNWATAHSPNATIVDKQKRDFLSMNKLAVQHNITDAKAVSSFYDAQDLRLPRRYH